MVIQGFRYVSFNNNNNNQRVRDPKLVLQSLQSSSVQEPQAPNDDDELLQMSNSVIIAHVYFVQDD